MRNVLRILYIMIFGSFFPLVCIGIGILEFSDLQALAIVLFTTFMYLPFVYIVGMKWIWKN